MRTANPVLTEETFTRYGYARASDAMTMTGVIWKTALLLGIALLTAGWTWIQFFKSGGNMQAITPWVTIGALGGFVLALAISFKPTWAPTAAPIYAALEGLLLGGLSAFFELSFPGIAVQAVMLTLGTLCAMLALYQSGIIRVTDRFRMGVAAATGGIAIVYLISWVMSFFGASLPFIYGSGMAGIGFSLIVVGVAALNLILDFDMIERGARVAAPKYMEWYSAFALMVTLVWLYIEAIRLLSKLRSKE